MDDVAAGAKEKLELEALRRENELLRAFWDSSDDALWCIEFIEPVDLRTPPREIIRQIFENECVWRMCNRAMARIYELPEGLDFNAENVRFVFPRNASNEEFVGRLIQANFHLDKALSLDQLYDGRYETMENDVRAKIESGKLLRMMGTVRHTGRVVADAPETAY